MKPIIAVDFDGALLKHRPFEKAHFKWFKVMSILLDDNSINEYATLKDYFGKLQEIMERYLGNVGSEARIDFARNLFAMLTVAETKKEDVVSDFVEYLTKLKDKYRLALITSAPEVSVIPILKKVNCIDLFDIVYSSPMKKQPSKKQLFEEFITEYEKPSYYIGSGDKDLVTCKELGIKSISVNWVTAGENKGDYDINTVFELNDILN